MLGENVSIQQMFPAFQQVITGHFKPEIKWELMVLDRSSQCFCEEAQVVLLIVKKPKMVCFWCLRRAETSQSELKERFTFQFEYIIVKHLITINYNATWEESECTKFSADSYMIDMDIF